MFSQFTFKIIIHTFGYRFTIWPFSMVSSLSCSLISALLIILIVWTILLYYFNALTALYIFVFFLVAALKTLMHLLYSPHFNLFFFFTLQFVNMDFILVNLALYSSTSSSLVLLLPCMCILSIHIISTVVGTCSFRQT